MFHFNLFIMKTPKNGVQGATPKGKKPLNPDSMKTVNGGGPIITEDIVFQTIGCICQKTPNEMSIFCQFGK